MTHSDILEELEELCLRAEEEIPLATTRIAHVRAAALANRLRDFQSRVKAGAGDGSLRSA